MLVTKRPSTEVWSHWKRSNTEWQKEFIIQCCAIYLKELSCSSGRNTSPSNNEKNSRSVPLSAVSATTLDTTSWTTSNFGLFLDVKSWVALFWFNCFYTASVPMHWLNGLYLEVMAMAMPMYFEPLETRWRRSCERATADIRYLHVLYHLFWLIHLPTLPCFLVFYPKKRLGSNTKSLKKMLKKDLLQRRWVSLP